MSRVASFQDLFMIDMYHVLQHEGKYSREAYGYWLSLGSGRKYKPSVATRI